MCGIVGIVTSSQFGFRNNEINTFNDMLVIDSLRGFDSTGVFGVSNKGNVALAKEIGSGARFVQTKAFHEFKTDALREGTFMVGHNRAATRGNVTDENAHPFCVDDKIVLVQNGTYKGSHKHHADVEVDTHAIAHVLAKEPDIEKALQTIDAAYALVWYDVSKKTLNIIRNDERPLFLAYTEQGSVVFASEHDMILFAANRNNLTLGSKPYLLKEHALLQFNLQPGEKELWKQDTNLIDAEYKRKPFQGNWQNHPALQSIQQYPGPRRYTHRDLVDNDDDVAPFVPMTRPGNHGGAANTESPSTRPGSADSLDVTWLTHAANNKFHEYHVTPEEAGELVPKVMPRRQREIMFELLDYVPCNSHDHCTCWYVYGTMVTPDNTFDKVLCYTIVKNRTENEIINMVGGNFGEGTITSVTEQHVTNPITAAKERLLSCYVAKYQPLFQKKEEEGVIDVPLH